MQHLDEGTIHAWLDGALDAEEAARVERHASECAECAAAVAEARGLVAGASRILGALDHTPGGVIPASPRPASSGSRKAPRSVWRVLHFTPARAAAAALVIVAAGTVLVMRNAPNDARVADAARVLVSHGPPPPTEADTVAVGTALPPAAPTAKAQRSPDRVPEVVQAPPSVQRQAEPPAMKALPVPTPRFGQLAERSAAAPVPAPRAAEVLADSTSAAKAAVAATSPAATSNAAPAPAGVAGLVGGSAPARARARAADKLSEITATALMDVEQQPAAALAGCYDVIADSAAALPRRIVLDSLPSEGVAPAEARRSGAAAPSRQLRILDASGSVSGSWERIAGNGVRVSIAQNAASPFDLHVVSPARLAGTKTIGSRVVTITLNRAADCSAR